MVQRKIGNIEFSANKKETMNLPRAHFLKRLIMHLKVNVDNATGVYTQDDILNLVKRIRVVADGSKIIKNIDMVSSYDMDKFQYGTAPLKVLSTSDGSAIIQEAVTYIDFELDEDEIMSYLPAFAVNSLVLEIDWADTSDIASSGVTLNSASISVSVEELRREDLEDSQELLESLVVFREIVKEVSITSTGELPIEVETGDRVYSGFYVRGVNNASRDNDFIENYSVEKDGTTEISMDFDTSRAQDKQEYSLESIDDGVTMVDFEGGLSADVSELKLKLNTTGTLTNAKAFVVVQEIQDLA